MKTIYISAHITFIFLLSFQSFVFATSVTCKKAEEAFQAQQFQRAISFYLSCKETQQDVLKLEKLAYAYTVIGQYSSAEETYQRAAQLPGFSSAGQLEYSRLLIRLDKREEAKTLLQPYVRANPRDKTAKELLMQLETPPTTSASTDYTLVLSSFNSAVADFSPFMTSEGLVFTSERSLSTKISPTTGQRFTKLFIWNESTKEVTPFSGPFDGRYNDGSASFSKDGQIMMFTRNKERKLKKGQARLQILESRKVGTSWTTPIPFIYTQEGYEHAHPAINPSATLLVFASNRSGSQDGMDLFYCTRSRKGEWDKPKNLGKEVNTAGHEVFPVFLDDTTVVFSSDGRFGLGGLDLFKTVFIHKKWSEPEHLPIPFNSPADDFGLYTADDMETGWFTSNRDGVEHIYQFDKLEKRPKLIQLWVQVMDRPTGQSLSGANLNWILNDEAQSSKETTGLLALEIEDGQTIHLSGQWEGLALTDAFYTAQYASSEADTVTLWLDYSGFKIKGKTVSSNDKTPLDQVEVKFCVKGTQDCFKVNSDDQGLFDFLVTQDQVWQISGQKRDLFSIPIELQLDNYRRDSTIYIELELNFESVEVDKSFTLDNIYYDFDSWVIRPDAERELDILIDFMNSNPEVVIELSSHTDSRGEAAYNQRLSQRRAESAVAYMVSKGISGSRIQAKGYGESQLRNHCKDGINCEEEEHQMNRRTEVRILDK
jgi:outer membrane protein OmpA-like peptidoglycan-associated protein/tetratricopeptide (TPR) repeat protein